MVGTGHSGTYGIGSEDVIGQRVAVGIVHGVLRGSHTQMSSACRAVAGRLVTLVQSQVGKIAKRYLRSRRGVSAVIVRVHVGNVSGRLQVEPIKAGIVHVCVSLCSHTLL